MSIAERSSKIANVNNHYLLDSWAILALLYEEEPAAGRVEELLQQAADGQATLFLSVINLGEVFYIFGRRRGVSPAEKVVAKIKQLPIRILPVDEKRVLTAAGYKVKYSISYADAFAAAAAAELEATLVTGDPELLALAGQVQLESLHRSSKM